METALKTHPDIKEFKDMVQQILDKALVAAGKKLHHILETMKALLFLETLIDMHKQPQVDQQQNLIQYGQSSVEDQHSELKSEAPPGDETIQEEKPDVVDLKKKGVAAVAEVVQLQDHIQDGQLSSKFQVSDLQSKLARRDETIQKLEHDANLQEQNYSGESMGASSEQSFLNVDAIVTKDKLD